MSNTHCCIVKSCPAFKSKQSILGYCALHNDVITRPDVWELAKAGKLPSSLAQFVRDVELGIYPKPA